MGGRASPNSVQAAWQAFRASMQNPSPGPAGTRAPPTPGGAAAATAGGTAGPASGWGAPSGNGFRAIPAGAFSEPGPGGRAAAATTTQSAAAGTGSSTPMRPVLHRTPVPLANARTAPTPAAARAVTPTPTTTGRQPSGAAPARPGATAGAAAATASPLEQAAMLRDLKRQVAWTTRSLGPVMSVVPGGEPVREEVDALIDRLEQLYNTAGRVSGMIEQRVGSPTSFQLLIAQRSAEQPCPTASTSIAAGRTGALKRPSGCTAPLAMTLSCTPLLHAHGCWPCPLSRAGLHARL